MGDEIKSKGSKWVKVLDAAGLLDEIEDGWSLPPGKPLSDATIEVRGSGGAPIPADVRVPSSPPVDADAVRIIAPLDAARAPSTREVLPTTPVEKSQLLASHGANARREPASIIEISNAKETHVGLPRGGLPGRAGERKLAPTPLEVLPVGRERVVSRIPARISVPMEPSAREPGVSGAIIDDPAVEAPRPPLATEAPPAPNPIRHLRELVDVGDFTGALDLAEEVLAAEPGNKEASRARERCRERLIRMYESRIGDFGRVPTIAVEGNDLIWRNLDPASGFVLSRIDGYSTFEDVLDISGLPRFETCRILDRLLQDGIIR